MENQKSVLVFLWVIIDIAGLAVMWYISGLGGLAVIAAGLVTALIGCRTKYKMRGLAIVGAIVSSLILVAFIFLISGAANYM